MKAVSLAFLIVLQTGCSMTEHNRLLAKSPDGSAYYHFYCRGTFDSDHETCAAEVKGPKGKVVLMPLEQRQLGSGFNFVEVVWSTNGRKVCILQTLIRNAEPAIIALEFARESISRISAVQCQIPLRKAIERRYGSEKSFPPVEPASLERWARSFEAQQLLLNAGSSVIRLNPISVEF